MKFKSDAHEAAHQLWKRGPWLVTIIVGGITGTVIAILFWFWANEPPVKSEKEQPPTLALDPQISSEINRLEFAQVRSRPVRVVELFFKFDREYTPAEVGHFRVLVEILGSHTSGIPALRVFGRDGYQVRHTKGGDVQLWGYRVFACGSEPDEVLPVVTQMLSRNNTPLSDAIRVTQELFGKGPFQSLGAFDGKHTRFFVTEPLAEKIVYFGLRLDNYVVMGVPIERIHIKKSAALKPLPQENTGITEDEAKIAWIELSFKPYDLGINHPPFAPPMRLDFDRFTPEKVSTALGSGWPPITVPAKDPKEVWPE